MEPPLSAVQARLPLHDLNLFPQRVDNLDIPVAALLRQLGFQQQRLARLQVIHTFEVGLWPITAVAQLAEAGQPHPVGEATVAGFVDIGDAQAREPLDVATKQFAQLPVDRRGSAARPQFTGIETLDRYTNIAL